MDIKLNKDFTFVKLWDFPINLFEIFVRKQGKASELVLS